MDLVGIAADDFLTSAANVSLTGDRKPGTAYIDVEHGFSKGDSADAQMGVGGVGGMGEKNKYLIIIFENYYLKDFF